MNENNDLDLRQFFDNETSTYTYLLFSRSTKEACLIDGVIEQTERDLAYIKELGLHLKYLIETHVHADHITSAGKMREITGAKIVYGSGANVPCAHISLSDGESLKIAGHEIKAIATPGHTSGCTSYYVAGRVFTGDALLIRGCGRTDFQQGSSELLYKSIREKLFLLPGETIIYPAHDYKGMTSSTIEEEKKWNPRAGGDKGLQEFIKIMDNLNLAKPKKIDVAVPANMKCGLID